MKIFLHTALILSVSGLHAEKPNIIVIFADDLGYADLGCQGQNKDVITPHLDEFAKEGVRFTAGYITAPQCSPSRVGLLTGRYQQRVGIDTIPDIPMPIAELTIADMLKPAGYFSGQVGKWHLEPNALCVNWAKKSTRHKARREGTYQCSNQRSDCIFPRISGI
jgi:arylsulfatase A-like enzyme